MMVNVLPFYEFYDVRWGTPLLLSGNAISVCIDSVGIY